MHTRELAGHTATGLGLFSLALGLTEVVRPGALGAAFGLRRPGLLRAYGVREIGAGLGLLSGHGRAGWMWARAAGDVMDLATLALARPQNRREAAGLTAAASAVVGVLLVDVLVAAALSDD